MSTRLAGAAKLRTDDTSVAVHMTIVVPRGDGLWLATFRAGATPASSDLDAVLLAGRVWLALVTFDPEPT